MRKIDRYVGIPICYILSIVNWFVTVFGGKDDSGPIKKVLFIELAEVGAYVVAHPAVAHSKRCFPNSEAWFLTFSGGKEILEMMGEAPAERIVVIRPDGLGIFLLDTLKAISRLRRERIDVVVNLEVFARFSTILAFMTGAPRRVGFNRYYEEGLYLGNLVTHKVMYNPHLHAAETYVSLIEAVKEKPDEEPRAKVRLNDVSMELPKLETSVLAEKSIRRKLLDLYPALNEESRLILLNPNASDIVVARRWPDEHFVKLAAGILKDEKNIVVLTGAPNERNKAEIIAVKMDSERVLNMAGMTTLRELIDLYNIADLLITNDSGPAHFASLTNVPVIVLFGPETPSIFGPLGENVNPVFLKLACSPCVSAYNQKKTPCRDNQCLKQISPEMILELAEQFLGASQFQRCK